MRNFKVIFSFALFLVMPAFAGAPNKGQTIYQNMASTTVPSAFGAGSQLAGPLVNPQSFEVCQTGSVPLAGCSYGTVANCSGCAANFAVPPYGCATFNRGEIRMDSYLCVKGLPPSTSSSAGIIFGGIR